MEFTTSLKKWFFFKNSNAARVGARIPLLNASGEPIGSDTFANIASKLGTMYYAECSTAASTAAKTVSISNYLLAKNTAVAIRFVNAINVASATLNINSTGAKALYYNGVALMPNVVHAGNICIIQYDGTKYNIVKVEGLEESGADSDLYVDMGLPSGVLWAKSNIDLTQSNGFAASPYQYDCSFFSWGNTDGHNPTSNTSFAPYNWGSVNSQAPYYEGQPYGDTEGNKLTTNIAPSYDAARVNLGSPWRMPTNVEFAELLANIRYINADGTEVDTTKTDKRVNVNGVMGLYLESRINGARLFFSCSGYGNGTSRNNRGSNGYYWSSTWSSARNARYLYFGSGGVNPQNYSTRYNGFTIRPVI